MIEKALMVRGILFWQKSPCILQLERIEFMSVASADIRILQTNLLIQHSPIDDINVEKPLL